MAEEVEDEVIHPVVYVARGVLEIPRVFPAVRAVSGDLITLNAPLKLHEDIRQEAPELLWPMDDPNCVRALIDESYDRGAESIRQMRWIDFTLAKFRVRINRLRAERIMRKLDH